MSRVPVRIIVDGFQFQRESIPKGHVFDCPSPTLQSYLLREGMCGNVPAAEIFKYVPSKPGSFLLVLPEEVKLPPKPTVESEVKTNPPPPIPKKKRARRSGYTTRVMTPNKGAQENGSEKGS